MLLAAADALDAEPEQATVHVSVTVDREAVEAPGDVPADLETAAASHEQWARGLRQRAAMLREALARRSA